MKMSMNYKEDLAHTLSCGQRMVRYRLKESFQNEASNQNRRLCPACIRTGRSQNHKALKIKDCNYVSVAT